MHRLLDLASRKTWRLTGRPVELAGAHSWLHGPTSRSATVADAWTSAEAERLGGVLDDAPDAGLLPAMAVLDGPHFASRRLHPLVRDFYEHTAAWHMEVWTGWSPLFWPAGELIARLFGRRVEQLALPMRSLELAHGMASRVALIRDRHGEQVATAWLRQVRATGRYVYSGCYSVRTLPGADGPSVHVAFPLESGNVQVFLRPSVTSDGGLRLDSPPGRFGQDGAYVTAHDGGREFAKRVPIHETFHVYVNRPACCAPTTC